MTASANMETLKEMIGIESVNSIEDALKVQEFIFSLIPRTMAPFTGRIGIDAAEDIDCDILEFIDRCREMKTGGWCALNAECLRIILSAYGISARGHNYGLANTSFTHVCTLVDFRGAGQILMDPYFNRVYTHAEGTLISFPELLNLARNHEFNSIHSTFGKGVKTVVNKSSVLQQAGSQREKSVLDAFTVNHGLNEILMQKFGTKDWNVLIPFEI